MATQWIPLTRFEPKSWLLSNGEIVTEPKLEQTSTGRKVRVAGTKESVYAGELDDLIGQAVQSLAATKGTSVLLNLTDWQAREHRALGYSPSEVKARMHLIHDAGNRQGKTVCWWRFKHPTLAFEAVLEATLSARPTPDQPGQQVVGTRIVIPTRNYYGDADALEGNWVSVNDASFTNHISMLHHSGGHIYAWREFVRDNQPSWDTSLLGLQVFAQQRQAVARYLEIVRAFEDYEAIQVPDFRDLAKPSWMDLEPYETNVNAELVNDLIEYLDSAPTIEQVAEMYQNMLQAMRSAGINVNGKSANDFLAALLAGDKGSVSMQVFTLAEENFKVDNDHKLSIHLPTGTFVVECTHATGDKDKVAAHWEEAKTVAALTGEESELLAYARRYAEGRNTKRTKAILQERTS